MQPRTLFPLIVTDQLAATRDFYVDTLGCEIVHDQDAYLQVRLHSGDDLAFMTRDGAPPFGRQPTFDGKGLIMSIFTADPDAHCKVLAGKGVKIHRDVEDKPWGLRSYVAADPNGILLDFFRPIEMPKAATG